SLCRGEYNKVFYFLNIDHLTWLLRLYLQQQDIDYHFYILYNSSNFNALPNKASLKIVRFILCRFFYFLYSPTPDLYCYYKSDRPYLRLAPLRAELIHRRPKLVIFRDAVSPAESLLLRQLGAPKVCSLKIIFILI